MDLPCTRRVDPVHQSPRTRMYGHFTHGTDPPPRPYSSGFPSLPNHLHPPPSPTHSRSPMPGSQAFTRFWYYAAVRLLAERRFPFRFSLIESLPPVPTEDPASSPEV